MMTAEQLLAAVADGTATVALREALADLVIEADCNGGSSLVAAALKLAEVASTPVTMETADRIDDIDLVLVQTTEALERLAVEMNDKIVDVQESVAHALVFVKRVRDIRRKR